MEDARRNELNRENEQRRREAANQRQREAAAAISAAERGGQSQANSVTTAAPIGKAAVPGAGNCGDTGVFKLMLKNQPYCMALTIAGDDILGNISPADEQRQQIPNGQWVFFRFAPGAVQYRYDGSMPVSLKSARALGCRFPAIALRVNRAEMMRMRIGYRGTVSPRQYVAGRWLNGLARSGTWQSIASE